MTLPNTSKKNYFIIKRVLDVCMAFSLTLVFCWLFPLIWCVIKLTADGTPIYVQKRLGKGKALFNCYKFRTMRPGTPERSTHETSSDAVTGVGSILRKTKLDELPQLINVLRGDMSLVGPRPCLPGQTEVINARASKGIFTVKPGVTGLAQIRGIDMSDPNKLSNTDADYVASANVVFDFKILVATFVGRGNGDRVAVAKSCSVKPVDK